MSIDDDYEAAYRDRDAAVARAERAEAAVVVFGEILDIVREARREGWYTDDPRWAAVDAALQEATA